MGAIFRAINPDSSMSVFGANRIWSGWEDLLNWSKMTRCGSQYALPELVEGLRQLLVVERPIVI
jgi:hypothetical protein